MRRLALILLIFATLLIAGCAINTPATSENTLKNDIKNDIKNDSIIIFNRQGRLSLRVDSEPPQALHGAFIIHGSAKSGDLTLNTPLGNTVAKLTWTPELATLQANGESQSFASTDALVEQLTGTPLPLAALFDWLAGKNTPALGWEVKFSAPNRFVAQRASPLPTAELRIVVDEPAE